MSKSLQFVKVPHRDYTQLKGVYLEVHFKPGIDWGQLIIAFSRVIYERDLLYTGRLLEVPADFFIYQSSRLSAVDEQDKEAFIDWLSRQPEIRAVHVGRVGETMAEYERSIGYRRRKYLAP